MGRDRQSDESQAEQHEQLDSEKRPVSSKQGSEVSVIAGPGIEPSRAVADYIADTDWMFKTGLGGMLTAASFLLTVLDYQHFLFVPVALALAAVLQGYLLRNTRFRVKHPRSRLPDWNDWADLFMSGITWITVQFCISVTAIGFMSVGVLLAVYAVNVPNTFTLAIVESAAFACLLIAFWTHFLTTYLWVNFALEERLGAGFALRKVTRQIRKNPKAFWTGWALAAGLQVAAIIIPAITLVGIFIVPSTLFAAQLLGSNILAQAWKAAEDQT